MITKFCKKLWEITFRSKIYVCHKATQFTAERMREQPTTTIEQHTFPGFSKPQSSAYPDQAFDDLMAFVSPAQWKIVCYIMRRTFGFKKSSDAISLDQICHGIVKRDGERLDHGTGLAKSTVIEAIYGVPEQRQGKRKRKPKPGLIEMGVLLVTKNLRAEGWNAPNTYRLRFLGEPLQTSERVETTKLPTAIPSTPDHPSASAQKGRGEEELAAHQTTPRPPVEPPPVRASDLQEHRTVLQPTVSQPDSPVEYIGKMEQKPNGTPRAEPQRGGGFKRSADLLREKRERLAHLTANASAPSAESSQVLLPDTNGAAHDSRRSLPEEAALAPLQPRSRSARITVLVETIGKDLGERKINSLVSQVHAIWSRTSMDEALFIDWLVRVQKDVKDRMRSGQHIAKPVAYLLAQLGRETGVLQKLPLSRKD